MKSRVEFNLQFYFKKDSFIVIKKMFTILGYFYRKMCCFFVIIFNCFIEILKTTCLL